MILVTLVGLGLLALGLFAGGLLVAAPLGLAPWSGDAGLLWLLFPLFSVAGYVLFVVGASSLERARLLSLAVSGLLLLLALAAALAIVLDAAAIAPVSGATLSLWYVLGVAGVVGAVGAASAGRSRARAA